MPRDWILLWRCTYFFDFFFQLGHTYRCSVLTLSSHIQIIIKNTTALKWCLSLKHFSVHLQLSFWLWTLSTTSHRNWGQLCNKCLMAGEPSCSRKPQRMKHYFEANVIFSFCSSQSILPIFFLLPFIFWPSSGFKWRKSCNKQKHFSKCWVSHIVSLQVKHFFCPCENCTKTKYLCTVYNKLMLCPNLSQSPASSF